MENKRYGKNRILKRRLFPCDIRRKRGRNRERGERKKGNGRERGERERKTVRENNRRSARH